MEGLAIGKAVWYTPLQEATIIDKEPIDTSDTIAIITFIHDKVGGVVNLMYFGTNDEEGQNLAAFPILSVGYSAEKVGHSWHWIEQV